MSKQFKLSTLALITTSLILTTNVYAAKNFKGEGSYKGEPAPMPAPCLVLKDGFYLGAQLGYDSYRVNRNVNGTAGGITVTSSGVTNATGAVGGLLAGYGQYFDMFYIGGEIFINTSDASQGSSSTSTSGPTSASSSFKVGTSYGISLLPGLKVNDSSLLYVRLGYNEASLKGSSTFTGAGTTVSGSKSSYRGGFNYGLGMETAFYPNWSVRGEYTHTNYGSFTDSIGTKWSPSDNQGMLALIYHFA